jgi:hypothetical protein
MTMSRGPTIVCEIESVITGTRCGEQSDNREVQLKDRVVVLCPACTKKHEKNTQEPKYWHYYSLDPRVPEWARNLVRLVADRLAVKPEMSMWKGTPVLRELAPDLHDFGYKVEGSKRDAESIILPRGRSGKTVRPDAIHPQHRVLLEIEGGPSVLGGHAVQRELIRASMAHDIRYLAVGVQRRYTRKGGPMQPNKVERGYSAAEGLLCDLYESKRLTLPLDGVLLFGY